MDLQTIDSTKGRTFTVLTKKYVTDRTDSPRQCWWLPTGRVAVVASWAALNQKCVSFTIGDVASVTSQRKQSTTTVRK